MLISDITREQVTEFLQYNPDSGVLTWIKRPSKAIFPGMIAGHPDAKGYLLVGFKRRVYKAHRLAWLIAHGEWPNGLIDHINGNKSDNRIANLRIVDEAGNSQNVRKPNSRNKSGYMGVIYFQKKWRASITVKGKTCWIGDYPTPEEAHNAYLLAKRKYHLSCTI